MQFATYDGMRRFPYWDNPAELEWWRLEVKGRGQEGTMRHTTSNMHAL